MAKPVPSRTSVPAAQHLVVRYAKRGKMRFASHRDVARAFERGVRRAELPIAYSAGFTPHPKISYAGGAPTGVASEAEYLTLALTSPREAAAVRERLNAVLPDGIYVIDVTDEADGGSPMGELEASMWRVMLPGVRPESAMLAVAGFLALEEAPVERLTDKGVRRLDARSAVVELSVLGDPAAMREAGTAVRETETAAREAGTAAREAGTARDDGDGRVSVLSEQDCAILRMVVLHTAPAVRPDDVLTALSAGHGIVPSSPPLITRLAQGQLGSLVAKTLTGKAVS